MPVLTKPSEVTQLLVKDNNLLAQVVGSEDIASRIKEILNNNNLDSKQKIEGIKEIAAYMDPSIKGNFKDHIMNNVGLTVFGTPNILQSQLKTITQLIHRFTTLGGNNQLKEFTLSSAIGCLVDPESDRNYMIQTGGYTDQYRQKDLPKDLFLKEEKLYRRNEETQTIEPIIMGQTHLEIGEGNDDLMQHNMFITKEKDQIGQYKNLYRLQDDGIIDIFNGPVKILLRTNSYIIAQSEGIEGLINIKEYTQYLLDVQNPKQKMTIGYEKIDVGKAREDPKQENIKSLGSYINRYIEDIKVLSKINNNTSLITYRNTIDEFGKLALIGNNDDGRIYFNPLLSCRDKESFRVEAIDKVGAVISYDQDNNRIFERLSMKDKKTIRLYSVERDKRPETQKVMIQEGIVSIPYYNQLNAIFGKIVASYKKIPLNNVIIKGR